MLPRQGSPRGPALAVAGLGLALLAVAIAGCSLAGSSFDPNGPCTSDGRQPGAYPQLEALVPTTLDGKRPGQLDSGRNCTAEGLGTLAGHGIHEVRFAGGIWQTGAESGTTLAVFSAPGLTAAELGEFYEAGARASSKVSAIETSAPAVQGRAGYRLDAENDGRLQSIVTWPDPAAEVVRVVIVSSAARDGATPASHADAVQRAIAASGG